jgi:predicted phage baseplate assembly protein
MIDPPFYDYDGDGATIRFGDGTFGLPPVPGTNFRARYLAGGGAIGNIAADSIETVAPGDPNGDAVRRCTNPFPATGGADAETRAQIRDRVPQQIKTGLLSLTGAADYQAAARSFSPADGGPLTGTASAAWARQAVAAFRWTGSWSSALTIVDPLVAEPAGTQLSNLAGLAELLNAKRLAGSDSSVALARYRWIDLQITCRAQPDARRGDVVAAILAGLDPQPAADGTTGFFGRDRWMFGRSLEAAELTAAIQSCPGVAGVTLIKCREKLRPGRWHTFGFGPGDILRIGVAPSEILRIDNDKDQPQHGLLFVKVEAAT